ncbi:MAG: hypothetical protein K2Q26_11255 [Bdellovibrionales bacterium]|nr:hypothetical protein [Bdellovibrionales bacterium]
MKIIVLALLLFTAYVQAALPKAQLRKAHLGTVEVKLVERLEAEPVSKPYAVVVTMNCAKGFKSKTKKLEINTCGSNLDDVRIESGNVLRFSHFVWDADKTSESFEGAIVCDKNNRIHEKIKLSDFCYK